MLAFVIMTVVLSHTSALQALRAATAHEGCASIAPADMPVRDFPREGWRCLKSAGTTTNEIAFYLQDARWSLSAPLHFMVAGSASKRTAPDALCHVYTDRLPQGSLVRLTRTDVCASPELCLFQLSDQLSLLQAVLIGCEFCGTYNLDANESRGFSRRNPLTTPGAFLKFLEKLGPRPGIVSARKAAGLLVAGAASPMESIAALILSVPRRLGGYGLPKPILNHRLDVIAHRETSYGSTFVCDMYWPHARVAVEYDSNSWHVGAERIAHDSERRTALERAGVRVVTLTNAQVRDRLKMDVAAELIAKLLKVRIRGCPNDWTDRKKRLRNELLKA